MLTVFCGCSQEEYVKINRQESWYSDFYVEDGKVYIKCNITVENSGDDSCRIGFKGDFSENVKTGLLKEAELYGYAEDYETSVFVAPKGKHTIAVTFIGDFGGTLKKANRNLPHISMVNGNN